jgi:hypothetical protein
MEYRFLSPPLTETTTVPLGLSRYYQKRLGEMYRNGVKIDWKVLAKAENFRLIDIPEGSRFWKHSIQPFLETELDKQLVAQGKTRKQWEEERERAKMQAWRDGEARLKADFEEAEKIAKEKEESEAFKELEERQYLRQKYGLIGFRMLLARRFKSDVQRTLRRVWERKVHINFKICKQRYLCSPRWMKFWIFLQEDVLHPIRWKFSIDYQVFVLKESSRLLDLLMSFGGYSPHQQRHADELEAIWDGIEVKIRRTFESLWRFYLYGYRYEKLHDTFCEALEPWAMWTALHKEAEELKAQEEAGKRLVATVEALGGRTTEGALGGVQ